VSKQSSKDRIGASIDGIFGNVKIRGREEGKAEELKELENLKKRVAEYEKLGSIEYLKQEKEEFEKVLFQLRQQQVEYKSELEQAREEFQRLQKKNEKLSQEQSKLIQVRNETKGQIGRLEQEKNKLMQGTTQLENPADLKEQPLREKDKQAYQPSLVISEYCEQPEGKRKLTIHLREIEYQAILRASRYHSSKGQFMDTITKALRSYIPNEYYQEAEREVHQKVMHSVRNLLENLGFSPEEIEKKIE
jgi:chromosome segregation ATPase